MRLAGQTAIVTGAARGIGFAVAAKLAVEGANLVLLDVLDLGGALERLNMPAERLLALRADITSESDMGLAVTQVIDRFGSVEILVNNAAIASGLTVGPFEQQTVEEWRRILDVNVIGVFIACRAVAAHMRARRYGRIINVASGTAFKGAPGLLHYIASKGAVVSMTRSLATELGADNIVVNAVSPGFTETEAALELGALIPGARVAATRTRAIQRVATPDDVAAAVFLLALEEARFVTGQVVPADGGSVMAR